MVSHKECRFFISHNMMVCMARKHIALAMALALLLPACSEVQLASHATKQVKHLGTSDLPVADYKIGDPYQVNGVWYYPQVDYGYKETGIASWYGPGFHGKKTANGETYDQTDLTAAHRTLPLPSLVKVTNLQNGRTIVVRINDRGPFSNGRVIDLSMRAAQLLGFARAGTAKVRVEILPDESRQLAALSQNREAAANAPDAAPVIDVTAVPLHATNRGFDAIAAAKPQLPKQPDGTLAEEKQAFLFEGDDGSVEEIPQVALAPAADAPNGVAALEPGVAAELRPDGMVTLEPVGTTNIFVQAGSFLRRDNATRLSARLSVLGRSKVSQALVGQRMYYRVRLGPVETVDEADRLLQVLLTNGVDKAQVVVD